MCVAQEGRLRSCVCHAVLCLAAESEDDLVAELRGFWSDDDWNKPSKKKDRSACPHHRTAWCFLSTSIVHSTYFQELTGIGQISCLCVSQG